MKIEPIFFILTITFFCSCKEISDGDRLFNESKLELENKFQHENGNIVRFYANDSLIYCSSSPENKIYIYSFDGEFKRTLGQKGAAPWENGTLWYFYCNDKYYWVHDYPKQRIKKYRYPSDKPVYQTKIVTSNNVIYSGGDSFFLPRIREKDKSFVFSLFNAKEGCFEADFTLDHIFQDKLLKGDFSDYILDGSLCEDGNYIAYACYYSGVFFIVDKKDFSIRRINDFQNLPIPKVDGSNGRLSLKPNQYVTRTACLYKNKLYALATNDPQDKRKRFKHFYVDVYDISTGHYIHSYDIPKHDRNKASRMAIVQGQIIIAFDNGDIITYKM